MDAGTLIISVIQLINRFAPPPKPPRTDYTSLAIPSTSVSLRVPDSANPTATPTPVPEPSHQVSLPQDSQKTGCIPCSRSHLSAVSGALGESLRFARDGGVTHPEVLRRVAIAEDEITVLERIDLAADAVATLPPNEKQMVEDFLPRIRALRQDLGNIASVEQLEKTAAEASKVAQEFRARQMKLTMEKIKDALGV